jgi:hypothetical protein
MDAFKVSVVVDVLVSWIALGVIYIVTTDVIQGAKIPDVEYGVVASKGLVENGELAYYTVTLESGDRFYIINNSTLYDSIKENLSYLFTCRIDYINQMTIIDSVSQVNRTAT